MLAASLDDQGILATDLRSGALVTTFEESAAQTNAFGAIGGNSGYIYAVQAKKPLWHVWAWGERKPCYRASLPEKMTAMTFTGDAGLCIGGSATGSIYIWQMGTGCLLRCWPAHFREVTQLLVSEDESFLVSASGDAAVHVYNMADIFAELTPKPFHVFSGHALTVTSLALLPGSGMQQMVASASLDRSVRIWDIGTGKPHSCRTLSSAVNSICVGPCGAELLCACSNGDLRSFSPNCSQDETGGVFLGHSGPVLSCALNRDGSCAASCSEVDRVRVWETRTRQCVSQAHTSRNILVGSVQIVQRAAFSSALPPFQPFRRIITQPEELPPVQLGTAGRAVALQESLEPHTSAQEFVEQLVWGAQRDAGAAGSGNMRELQTQLAEAKATQARWAAAATDLYDVLVSEGKDGRLAAELPPLSGVTKRSAKGGQPLDGKSNSKLADDPVPVEEPEADEEEAADEVITPAPKPKKKRPKVSK